MSIDAEEALLRMAKQLEKLQDEMWSIGKMSRSSNRLLLTHSGHNEVSGFKASKFLTWECFGIFNVLTKYKESLHFIMQKIYQAPSKANKIHPQYYIWMSLTLSITT